MRYVRSGALRALLLALFWLVLAGPEGVSWVAVVSVGAAVAVSLRLSPPGEGMRPLALLGFLPYFLRRSLVGSFDIARRALSPRSDAIHPGFCEYAVGVRGRALTFLMGVISLLPGTLSVELEDGRLRIHTIDDRRPILDDVAVLERRVARVWGQAQGEVR